MAYRENLCTNNSKIIHFTSELSRGKGFKVYYVLLLSTGLTALISAVNAV